ncbi:MAG: hypothetical protein DCC69_06580 [Hyphomicrobiales bacterium]|nr:MAG: hypothetical protein DCC69_06580 [Hyphomicrobiales bacterium]
MIAKTATNHIRKVRALLAKTTTNGCERAEAASALSLASTIITKHGLNPADFIWPEPPAGWRWEGVRGHGGTVVEAPAEKPKRTRAAKAKAKQARKPKAPAEPKPKRPTRYDRVAEMLQRPEGVTIAQMTAEFGILAHTARAMISIGKRRAGLTVAYDKESKVYRATAA